MLRLAPLAVEDFDPWTAMLLSKAFAAHLIKAGDWAEVLTDDRAQPAPNTRVILVHPRVDQRLSLSRTYALDALAVMTLQLFPFSISWGEVDVALTIDLFEMDGTPIARPITVAVSAPHSTLVYATLRSGEIEAAFRRAYARAFADGAALVAKAIAGDREPLARASFLEPQSFDVLTRPLEIDDETILSRYLGALGGVELATFRGGAQVESRTFTANSADELVGSGRAESSGYRFSFFRPPDRTGFFFPPSIGLLWQDITITGFRDALPLARSTDIPAVASDPASGAKIDLGEPLSYDLRLRSGFIGQGLGLNLVAGDEDVQLFLTLAGHVNLVEIRHVGVTLGRTQIEGVQVVGFRSAGFDAQAGLVFPGAHLALRGLVQSEKFFEFDFPQPVEFQAATRFNREKDVFERERAFVRGASLWTYNAQISLAYLF